MTSTFHDIWRGIAKVLVIDLQFNAKCSVNRHRRVFNYKIKVLKRTNLLYIYLFVLFNTLFTVD